MQRLLSFVFFLITCAVLIAPAGADNVRAPAGADDVRALATEARRTSDIGGAQSRARLDFLFGDIRAWLLQDGNWHIEGNIAHHGARCGEYELGIQFGTGSPGCANVEWLGTPVYVTSRRQCNNALLNHVGGDLDLNAAGAFDQINCAQRLIRCTGNCK